MEAKKSMLLLLIEDDEIDCNSFRNLVSQTEDIKFIGITNSSMEGLEFVKTHMPEGIIVDLELHNGSGSGLEFLKELKSMKLDFKPIIIVTTNISSDIIYNYAHENGADVIFYKKQTDYSAKLVVNTLLLLRRTLQSNKKQAVSKDIITTETIAEQRERLSNKINTELNLIGISSHLRGRKYLYDAMYYLLEESDKEDKESVFYYLAKVYKRANSSISRAMQTAINHAWRISPIEDLEVHYTARINYETGVPTPTEFIYYYRDKIKKAM